MVRRRGRRVDYRKLSEEAVNDILASVSRLNLPRDEQGRILLTDAQLRELVLSVLARFVTQLDEGGIHS